MTGFSRASSCALACALAATAILCAVAPTAFALSRPTPVSASSVTQAQATLDAALRRYDSAAALLASLESSISVHTRELDALVARQTELETTLGSRATQMYRMGPVGFLEVLVGSASFADFLTRWDALVRLGRADATTVQQIRDSRERLSATIARMLQLQTAASRQLRVLDAERATARRTLRARTSARAALEARLARQRARSTSLRSPDGAAPTAPSSATVSRPSGSRAPWSRAVASCYGAGSYGIHLASGYTIGPDSMIVAHKTLPFGTQIEFSYGGRTGIAVVADRGPFVAGRAFDLGPGITRLLGFDGVGAVRYRVLSP